MHVKSLRASHFRRFTELTIAGIPTSTRLVVLAGPNGVGKSSVFFAFPTGATFRAGVSGSDDESYYRKSGETKKNWHEIVDIAFHEPTPTEPEGEKKAFYFRSAERHESEF